MKKAIWLIMPLIICMCGPATAEFYKYTDKNGNIRFTDDLSKVPENQRPNVKSYEEAQSSESPAPSTSKKKEAEQIPAKKGLESGIELDAQGQLIKTKQEALDKEYKSLMDERARLESESKDSKTADETDTHNQKVLDLNNNIRKYEEKRKNINAEIEAYNAKMSKKNKKKPTEQDTKQ